MMMMMIYLAYSVICNTCLHLFIIYDYIIILIMYRVLEATLLRPMLRESLGSNYTKNNLLCGYALLT